jgi:hypothetical protein
VAPRADGPLRVVRGVVGELREELGADLGGRPADERHERAPVGGRGRRDPGELAERGVEVDLGDERVADPAATEASRAADDEHDADPPVGEPALGPRDGEPVIRGEHHERVVRESRLVEPPQDLPDPAVQGAGARREGRHVGPGLGRVGQPGRRGTVEGVARRAGLEEPAVGLEEPDRQEERLRRARREHPQRGRRHRLDPGGRDVDHLVVAEGPGVLRDVLLADERRPVPRPAEGVDEMPARVGELPSAMGQSRHAVDVRPLAREQAGPASRARRRGAEALRKRSPSSATRRMCGVRTACP